MRCRIVLLIHASHSVRGIAERVDCVRATVYRTPHRFEELGEAGLTDRRLYSDARKVTPELMNYLLSLLDVSPSSMGWQRPTWTLELLASQIEEKMRARLFASHIRNLLLWMGMNEISIVLDEVAMNPLKIPKLSLVPWLSIHLN